ncbi:putative glucan endo-1,3-beta-D-glucosidase [Rosa chinensis]|uniref:Putative glucan endo-1,3-beta-D-glucosidase n=1 Tax=Rosa chinensis TaxID=74649 RepID=A0A2P6Q5D1_ROSCH|nr:glucan endo-1,3-beta-glucosidase 1 [Rosa chinensis]PRQ29393.1 putative glucan endo-1,3-beta-D-glucosidase [Rosa chinensis]
MANVLVLRTVVIVAFLALSNLELCAIADLPGHGHAAFMADIAKNTWCVAKPTAADSLLQLNIDFACSKVNCSVIEPGGECQLPDTIMNHASVAMNLYYQSFGRTDLSCYFQSTGMVVIEDPSSGTCVYEGVVLVRDAVPASIKIKKGESKAFSATSIGLMVVWSITGCGLVAVAVYVMLWLRQNRTPVVGVPVHTLPEPLYLRLEPSAPPLPV